MNSGNVAEPMQICRILIRVAVISRSYEIAFVGSGSVMLMTLKPHVSL